MIVREAAAIAAALFVAVGGVGDADLAAADLDALGAPVTSQRAAEAGRYAAVGGGAFPVDDEVALGDVANASTSTATGGHKADAALSAVADAAAVAASEKTPECKQKQDPHGTWNGTRMPGGAYILTCDHGFAVDERPSISLSCTSDVQWPAEPWCENVDDCAKLVHACGPAGLCKDHEGWAECLCENGAIMHNTTHDEVVCYFENEDRHCGGRNCGAHGICIDLTEFQDSFDSGAGQGSFRCSCERGFRDDGTSCVPRDCGPKVDPLGKWSGETTFQGEYTLTCDEGAFLWGGSHQAITITCSSVGVWKSHPVCKNPTELAHEAEWERFCFWMNISMAFVCVCCAALAAGLTMGLVSLDERELQIINEADISDGDDSEERETLQVKQSASKRLAPIVKDHHRLLVTLLLLNALANEALPIFLDDLMPPWLALLVSVTFVLFCGEIIPSAIFTGPMQLTVAARFIPVVECLQSSFSAVARPIAKFLDKYLGHDEDQLYSRPEIKAVLCLHSQGGDPRDKFPCRPEHTVEFAVTPSASTDRSRGDSAGGSLPGSDSAFIHSPLGTEDGSPRSVDSSPDGFLPKENPNAPLTSLEAELCLNSMRLGELKLHSSEGFHSLRSCSRDVHPVDFRKTVAETLREGAEAGKELVVVFRKTSRLNWPAEVHVEDILGVLHLAQLLTEKPTNSVNCFFNKKCIPTLRMEDCVIDALKAIKDADKTPPLGFGAIVQHGEFAGLLDGERALMELLGRGHRQEIQLQKRLDQEVQQAVAESAQVVLGAREGSRSNSPMRRRRSAGAGGGGAMSLSSFSGSMQALATVQECSDGSFSSSSARRRSYFVNTGGRGSARAVDAAFRGRTTLDGLDRPGRATGAIATDPKSVTANIINVALERVISSDEGRSSVSLSPSGPSSMLSRRSTDRSPSPDGEESDEEEAFVIGVLSTMTTQGAHMDYDLEEPVSPTLSVTGEPLRREIRQAYMEYEQDLEALGRRSNCLSPAASSPEFRPTSP